jgi:Effector Associated Constant Component 1
VGRSSFFVFSPPTPATRPDSRMKPAATHRYAPDPDQSVGRWRTPRGGRSRGEGGLRVDVTIAVIAGEHPGDELRSLRSWLAGDEDLAGLVDRAGAGPDVVTVAVDAPGAAAALANSLVALARDHSRDVRYEVARPDGVSVRLSARRVRETDGAMVRDLIVELCRSTEADGDTDADTVADAGARADAQTA